jgi:class 3 adenylate cyclase
MEQQIRFCTGVDGVPIAYAVVGSDGPPVIYVTGFPSHLELEWERPSSRAMLESLAAGSTLVRYDMRGCGLSDADVADFSLPALVRDLEAVVDAFGAKTFALLSLGMLGGPTSINYAAAHPERVARIVLCSAFVSGARVSSPARQAAFIEYTEKFGVPVLDYAESDNPAAGIDRTGRDILHIASSPAIQASLLRTLYSVNIQPELGGITMPATVLHGRNDKIIPFAEGRRLAAQLPGAEFVPIDGNTGAALTEQDQTIPAVRRALGLPAPVSAAGRGGADQQAVRVILFTDIVGHTEMMQRLGDVKGRDVLREHERITRETLNRYGGAEVKTMGDGFLASFGSITHAMECAVALQRAFARHTEAADEPLSVRVGLNAGEPIEEDGDLFGSAVILAARIAAEAEGGEILVPEPVRHLLSGKAFIFSDRGEFAMKGFDDAVRLYQVQWRE